MELRNCSNLFNDKIWLSELVENQIKFDKYICEKHNLKYEEIEKLNRLALQVEINELCAETKIFKYWSVNFNKIDREKALEEYADCLHFVFSILGLEGYNPLKNIKFEDLYKQYISVTNEYKKEGKTIIDLFQKASKDSSYKHGLKLLRILVVIGHYLEFKDYEILEYYSLTCKKNKKRQEENY